MAGKLLKETKDTEIKKKKRNYKVEDDNNIRKIEEDNDIDEIFGNVNRWLKDAEEEVIEKRPRRRLAKIEEGIRSSKTTKAEKIETKKTKKTTKTRTSSKSRASTKTSAKSNSRVDDIYGLNNLEDFDDANYEKTTDYQDAENYENVPDYYSNSTNEQEDENIESISGKPSEIKIHTENELTEIVLKRNRYKIELQKTEYNIYTDTNETSYVIVRDPMLKVISGGVYILLEKQGEDYEITTNQDFKINYVIDNLERKNNTVNFKLTNLTEIVAYEDGLVFEIDEEKVIENNLEDNNTLVISEEDGKVYLPYTKEDIKNEVVQNKGTRISEVIENKYTLPLDKYKNSMRARFREGYNLMYRKEGKSKRSAIMLGIELMFETNLHPAIISACKNLEELDIYLDCLEDNELEKFSCFKIIYKSLPTLRKKTKFQEF